MQLAHVAVVPEMDAVGLKNHGGPNWMENCNGAPGSPPPDTTASTENNPFSSLIRRVERNCMSRGSYNGPSSSLKTGEGRQQGMKQGQKLFTVDDIEIFILTECLDDEED